MAVVVPVKVQIKNQTKKNVFLVSVPYLLSYIYSEKRLFEITSI